MDLNLNLRLNGISQWSKQQKIDFLAQGFFADRKDDVVSLLKSFWHPDPTTQKIFDDFSENTLSNYYMPYGIAPHFLIDNENFIIPMVIEESSVVAAASKSAKFWRDHGGFQTEIISTTKVGQVHFFWEGEAEHLFALFEKNREILIQETKDIILNMEKRGGGITSMELTDRSDLEKNYYQIFVTFETCDAMGANFINSILERISHLWRELIQHSGDLPQSERQVEIVMSILSNYTPECRVKVSCSCKLSAYPHAEKLVKAVRISEVDVFRATTHNKGIFNGIDAVVLATGNDFRAVEAAGHTYAARSGRYRGLSRAQIYGDSLHFSLEVPMALGTIGGLTTLHPLAKLSLQLLGMPSAQKLMRIAASVGLAQNFAALTSLITTGIQKGHMRMHLMNILNSLAADDSEREKTGEYFKDRVISFKDVRCFIESLRQLH